MKANATTSTSPLRAGDRGQPKRVWRGVATGVIGLLALSACTSDPGPKRVAQDIIKAESLDNPDLDEECLLGKLDDYSNSDLEAISEGLLKTGPDKVEAEAQLAQYQADLETCN